jgi:hypothetical protein
MEFALVIRELARRRLALAIGVLVAVVAAVFSVYRLDGTTLKPRSLQYSSASTRVFVDTSSSVLGNLSQSFEPLQSRATVYANFMASPTVLNLIGQRVGLSGSQIYAAGPVDPQVPRIVQEPTAVQRNVEITGETTPYRLNFNSDPNLPTIGIYAQAPTTKQAIGLADASVTSLEQYVGSLESADHIPQQSRIVIRQLGEANGGVVDGGISKALAVMVFLAVFVLWCVLMLVGARFRESWRASGGVAASIDREAKDRKAEDRNAKDREAAETQIMLRTPVRDRSARESAVERAVHNGDTQGDEPEPATAGPAELHARLRASGS